MILMAYSKEYNAYVKIRMAEVITVYPRISIIIIIEYSLINSGNDIIVVRFRL